MAACVRVGLETTLDKSGRRMDGKIFFQRKAGRRGPI